MKTVAKVEPYSLYNDVIRLSRHPFKHSMGKEQELHALILYFETVSNFIYIRFSSVSPLCLTLCNSINCSTPGLHVHHQLLEFTQTHVHRVRDAIQPSHPRSSLSPPAPNPSQHQSLFQ